MLVMVLENVPPSLRGELTRWLIEPRPGVFVGHVSALVRDRLWATQFHPEKSGAVGLRLLANWVNLLRDEETHGHSTGD